MSSPSQPATAVPSKKGGAKWVLLAVGVLALAGAGVVVSKKLGKPPVTAEPVKKAVVVDPGILELQPFILNLADPSGDRYFRLNLRLVLDQKPIAERAKEGLAQAKLRDHLLGVLAKKRASDMADVAGKERLRTEILVAAEALLGETPFFEAQTDPAPARVLEVFFTEFLVQ